MWPENPTYQVYVPGYHTALPNVSVGTINNNHRARSVSPEAAISTITSDHPRANSRGGQQGPHGGGQGILYAELQFPVTSNYGSMKKRSQRDRVHPHQVPGIIPGIGHHAQSGISQEPGSVSGNTTATTSVNSGEPSPTMMASMHDGLGSMDSVHRYVPDYVAVSTRKTAV